MSPFNTRVTEFVVISLRNVIFLLYDQIWGHGNPPPYADAVLEQ
jgi:hypothetical protein